MAKRTGTTGDDTLAGTTNDDVFDAFQGGNDTLTGKAGDDLFRLGAFFAPGDSIVGGSGFDTLELDGSYSSSLHINGTMLNSVERIELAAGNNYFLAFHDGVVASGKSLIIDASAIAAGNLSEIDLGFLTAASSETTFIIKDGTGLTRLTDGPGTTVLQGGSGQDIIYVGTNFTGDDRFDGGGGISDVVHFNGDLSGGLMISGTMLKNFENLYVDEGFSYDLTLKDSVVAAGQQLQVTAANLATGESLRFDASLETDGSVYIYDSRGNDVLRGSVNADYLQGSNGGIDELYGMAGDDVLQMADQLTAADRINGGAGDDEVSFIGDYSAGLVLDDATIRNVEHFYFNPGAHINLTIADGTVAAGQTLTATGVLLGKNDDLHFNGSAETDGHLDIRGGEGSDTMLGGAIEDTLSGSLKSDVLTGGGGGDTFRYLGVLDSRGNSIDHVTDFDAAADRFSFEGTLPAPTGVDTTITTGTLNAATFLTDLAAVLHAGVFATTHAVIFTASSGDLAGHSYLAVGGNGAAGFQGSGDLLIDITGATNLGSFGIDNFL